MRKMFRTIMKLIAKGVIGFTFVVFLLSICALDSERWLSALVVCGTSFVILAIYAIVNGAMEW